MDDLFATVKEKNARFLKELKAEAAKKGKEPFDFEKLGEFYYPDCFTDEQSELESRLKNKEMDYYLSKAMTIKEFAEECERYDVIKDSTGHD